MAEPDWICATHANRSEGEAVPETCRTVHLDDREEWCRLCLYFALDEWRKSNESIGQQLIEAHKRIEHLLTVSAVKKWKAQKGRANSLLQKLAVAERALKEVGGTVEPAGVIAEEFATAMSDLLTIPSFEAFKNARAMLTKYRIEGT